MYRDNAKYEIMDRTLNSECISVLSGLVFSGLILFLFLGHNLFIPLWLSFSVLSLIGCNNFSPKSILMNLFLGGTNLISDVVLKAQYKYFPQRFMIQDN